MTCAADPSPVLAPPGLDLPVSDLPVLDPPVLDHRPDIRLIAADMDGSLLDGEDRIDESLWPLLVELDRRGIVFCPASGRPYVNLAARFDRAATLGLAFIAENGAHVVRDGKAIAADLLEVEAVHALVRAARDVAAAGSDVGSVVCGLASAYVERSDDAFLAEVERYYTRLEVVDDLLEVRDDVLKFSVYDFGEVARTTAPAMAPLGSSVQLVVSGEHWLDAMSPTANKGVALRHLQDALGVTAEQTMAFGDYLNDLELLDAAVYSFAMDNAHPEVRARARYVAPANTRNGVARTIASVLGIALTA